MSKVLVINGSMNAEGVSVSTEITKIYVEEYLKVNPKDEIIWLDLNDVPMANKTINKYNQKDFFTEEDALVYIHQLKEVDKVIVTSPMTNFSTSGLMRNYLDHICLAGETFSYKYSVDGDAKGLLTNLKVQVITTQGAPFGWYMWGNHTEYLRGTWQFLGAFVMKPIILTGTKVEPFFTMKPKDVAETIREQIVAAVKRF